MKVLLGVVLSLGTLVAQGPYPVGVSTAVIVDSSRTDRLTNKPRTLVTEIWYPADDKARTLPVNRYTDFYAGAMTPELKTAIEGTYHMPLEEIDKTFWEKSVRDAPVRKGRFPLIVFSHGNGGSRFQNTFWCDFLASQGYIIVSPDHTGNARYTVIDGQLIRGVGAERLHSVEDRPKDMSLLLDEMIRWNKSDKRFAGHIDTDHAAVTGMSLGSYSAIQEADADPRFIAVVAMAAAPASHTNAKPTLFMLGQKDNTIGMVGNGVIVRNYEAHTGPAMLVELLHGGHYSFTDMFKLVKNFGDGVGPAFTPMETTYEIINSYSRAFLGLYLKGQKEDAKFLESNPWPEEVSVKRKLSN